MAPHTPDRPHPMTNPQAPPIVLRPSFRKYLATVQGRAGAPLVAVLVLTALVKLVAHPVGADVFLLLIAGGATLILAPVGLYLLIARIRLEDDHVTWRSVIRHGSFPIRAVDKMIYSDVGATLGASDPVLDIRDHSKRRLLRVRTSYWSDQSVATLKEFLAQRFYT